MWRTRVSSHRLCPFSERLYHTPYKMQCLVYTLFLARIPQNTAGHCSVALCCPLQPLLPFFAALCCPLLPFAALCCPLLPFAAFAAFASLRCICCLCSSSSLFLLHILRSILHQRCLSACVLMYRHLSPSLFIYLGCLCLSHVPWCIDIPRVSITSHYCSPVRQSQRRTWQCAWTLCAR